MLTRRTRSIAARLVLGALLFVQAALAVAACEWQRATPAQAFIAASEQPSCHELPARNANLCLAHCLSGDQSTGAAQLDVPGLPAISPLRVETTQQRAVAGYSSLQYTLPPPGAPPPRILFQSFLI